MARDSGLTVEGGTVNGVFNKAGRGEKQNMHSLWDFFMFEVHSGLNCSLEGERKPHSNEVSECISPPSAVLSICLNSLRFIC